MKNIPINFKYKFSDDYNPVYANGAYGGVNPRGELVMNFYFERNPIPYQETKQLNEDGEFIGGAEIEPEEHQTNVIRYISTGVVMNLDSAKSFHQWLGQHIEQLEKENGIESGDE
ncbi:MAG TPA: hypothetical protein VK097_12650 [Lentibacillus sp.]|uniref:hypothetical protein n=1 Tax=Lentibacillus sp. TaxID=1925746 RepID=UPI002B4B53BE|nr:hypothetical protein [Lentibacillus sp.]HLR63273.1 hypothetical protein [Lentibacillus sp.]